MHQITPTWSWTLNSDKHSVCKKDLHLRLKFWYELVEHERQTLRNTTVVRRLISSQIHELQVAPNGLDYCRWPYRYQDVPGGYWNVCVCVWGGGGERRRVCSATFTAGDSGSSSKLPTWTSKSAGHECFIVSTNHGSEARSQGQNFHAIWWFARGPWSWDSGQMLYAQELLH